jgi:small-conductance mechanosensitive channel
MGPWKPAVGVAVAVIAALAVAWLVDRGLRRAGRADGSLSRLSRRTRTPFRYFLVAIAAYLAMQIYAPAGGWQVAEHVLLVIVVGTTAWLITSLLFVLEDSALPRLRTDVADNRRARAVRTQLVVLRRVTGVVIAILALGTALLTFREVRVVGTSLLASAGVAAAIAAFAANALLSNVVAGTQIAFSGSLRFDDVVVVNGEWGRIEEITLTYVVVHIWDDRRLILPTSYFTSQVFENWTHTNSALIGEILIDVDWTVDLNPLRSSLKDLLATTQLWDGRVCVVQMTDAVGGNVTIRALVSARDAPTLWDLRCLSRENLVEWIREQKATPRTRADVDTEPTVVIPHLSINTPFGGDRVFSGDPRSQARGESFGGPDELERGEIARDELPRDDDARDDAARDDADSGESVHDDLVGGDAPNSENEPPPER